MVSFELLSSTFTNPHDLKDLTRSVQLFCLVTFVCYFASSWPKSTSLLAGELGDLFWDRHTVSKALACSKLATVARRTSKLGFLAAWHFSKP